MQQVLSGRIDGLQIAQAPHQHRQHPTTDDGGACGDLVDAGPTTEPFEELSHRCAITANRACTIA